MNHGSRGQATVELVLVVPLLALMLSVVVQVAVVARDRVLVAHAAQEAARAASVEDDAAGTRAARTVVADAEVTIATHGDVTAIVVRAPVRIVLPIVGRWFGGRFLTERAVARRQP